MNIKQIWLVAVLALSIICIVSWTGHAQKASAAYQNGWEYKLAFAGGSES